MTNLLEEKQHTEASIEELGLPTLVDANGRLDVELAGPADLFEVHSALRRSGLRRIRTWVERRPIGTDDGGSGVLVLRVTAELDRPVAEADVLVLAAPAGPVVPDAVTGAGRVERLRAWWSRIGAERRDPWPYRSRVGEPARPWPTTGAPHH